MADVFTLELPTEDELKEEVVTALAPTPKEEAAIITKSQSTVDQIMSIDLSNFEQRKEYTDVIEKFGIDDLKNSRTKNAILQKRMGSFEKAGELSGLGEAGVVAKGLEDLTIKMKDLDPSGIDFVKQGAIGRLFNPVRRYFEKYKTADQEIAEIVKSLEKGKKTLITDNTTLELEETKIGRAHV